MKPKYWLVVTIVVFTGCGPLFVRSQSPEKLDSLLDEVDLVGDLAVASGMKPVVVESVGLITGLDNTGSDPPPSTERAELLGEMQTRKVVQPNQVLASPSTAIVLVRGYLRPGIQKGDRFDIEVRVPSQSETTSLRGGWLMQARLRERRLFGSQIHDGSLLALCEGPILVAPRSRDEEDNIMDNRGRILGGGVAVKSRPLQLVMTPGHRDVRVVDQIGKSLNRRFHTFSKGIKEGVATGKTDQYIELVVHPRYKDNIPRYVQVVRNVAVGETSAERLQRLEVLGRQLLDPVSSATAALRLEAIGSEAVDVLRTGLESKDHEVRFYSAEALAYLDESDAAPALADAARNEPAFRVFALTALSAMDDFTAYEELRKLLDVPSAETRYGAFRSLWAMNAYDPLVQGEQLGGEFSYHLLDVPGPAMIHVTRSYRPEIVLFGHEQRFAPPLTLDAGKAIMVNAREGDQQVTISRFAVNEPDQKRVVSTRVDDVIRAIVELGGTYPDVVDALQQAKQTHSLTSRLEVDALPTAGRSYERELGIDAADEAVDFDEMSESQAEKVASNPSEGATEDAEAAEDLHSEGLLNPNPAPDLFNSNTPSDEQRPKKVRRKVKRDDDSEETGGSRFKGFLGRMIPGGSDS